MTEKIIEIGQTLQPIRDAVEVKAPSNIAIVKYWGKHGVQLPNNPSLSLTLKNAVTKTKLSIIKEKPPGFELFFEGEANPAFEPKIQQFLDRVSDGLPMVKNHHFRIESENSFPHSSGIASSASSFSALSWALLNLCSSEIGRELKSLHSYISRLGSGSASRSSFAGWALWGKLEGSDKYSQTTAKEVEDIHPVFQDYRDTIVIVDEAEKAVSSTKGHHLMNGHDFAQTRYELAHKNCNTLLEVLKTGDLERFVQICEDEALQLHALMMMSKPYFILLKPETLRIIDLTRRFRSETGIPIAFTCDAGPNVHLLYPGEHAPVVDKFLEEELKNYHERGALLFDGIGNGPEVI